MDTEPKENNETSRQQVPLKPFVRLEHPTKEEIITALNHVADQMETIGVAMEYYGGFGKISQHGKEMIGAANIAREWAEGIGNE